jgi:hypothetical protein
VSGVLQLLLARAGVSSGVTVIQSFTATGEWTCPTGVTEVEYLVVAGGGGGGFDWWRRWVLVVLELRQDLQLLLEQPIQ